VDLIQVRRALISVSDKTGVVDLGRRLAARGVEIVSSGGTARVLQEAGIPVVPVSEVTGHPEMLEGRVKTLHPAIHAGILADLERPDHVGDLEAAGIAPFQLVVVNLYPFRQVAARGDASEDEIVENIDIGGPTLIRAAAKNHRWVAVVTSPRFYGEVAEAVENRGLDLDLRRRLAREAFFHTAAYDAAIVAWLERSEGPPERMVLPLVRHSELRYGENPHQEAALYSAVDRPSWWEDARRLQGKDMSYNNWVDADAAWSLAHRFDRPACVIVKHTNPCGVAVAADLREAFLRAWDCDPVSAFGSVIAVNRPLDAATAEAMAGAGFIEVVIAPEVTDAGPLTSKRNLRLLAAPPPFGPDPELRQVDGGFVAQQRDRLEGTWRVVTVRRPEPGQIADLEFAWKVAAHTKSNAVVLARDGQAVGVGAGDQSRVGAAQRALRQAGDRARGAVAASDAFFPFRDGIDLLAEAGVEAVIAPGGSVRDQEVIEAADQHGMVLLFADKRHFRH
jgi:phosphoribosylaminoimidazolecarboxamide formyltransferase/IMP cyclohydrolase